MLTNTQKQKRKGKVTSSIAAAALGVHPTMTPLQAWLSCLGRSEFAGNKATERGDALEPYVLDRLAESLKTNWFQADTVVRDWTADSADALLENGDVAEVKTRAMGMAHYYGEEDTDEIYAGDLVQAHWHLMHHQTADRCWVGVLVGGYAFEFRRYCVWRSDAFLDKIKTKLRKWYEQYVVTETMPPAEAGDLDIITSMHASSGATLDASDDVDELIVAYRDAHAAVAKANKAKQSARAAMAQRLAECDKYRSGAGSIRYGVRKGKWVTNWEAIARELGATDDDVKRHSMHVDGKRVLTVYPKRG